MTLDTQPVEAVSLPAPSGELQIRRDDRIAWRDPLGCGGVTIEARVVNLAARRHGDLAHAALDVAPSEAMRRYVAFAHGDALTRSLRSMTLALLGLGGPLFVTGEDLRRAAREGRLAVIVPAPVPVSAPSTASETNDEMTGWYSDEDLAWARSLDPTRAGSVYEAVAPAPGAVTWLDGDRRLVLVTEVTRAWRPPTGHFPDFVCVGTVGRHVRRATADDRARVVLARAGWVPRLKGTPALAQAFARRLSSAEETRPTPAYYAEEPTYARIPMSVLSDREGIPRPPMGFYQDKAAPLTIEAPPRAAEAPAARPIDWVAMRDKDKPYESMARDLERRIEAYGAEARARAERAMADPYVEHRVTLEARGVEPRPWRLDQIDAAAARAWVTSPWVRGFSHRLSDTGAPSLDALLHDTVRRDRREDNRRGALQALLLTRPLAPTVGADGYEVAPPRHVTQAGPRQIVGGTRYLEEHAPAILTYAWEQTHFCCAPHVTPHQLQEAFQIVLDEMSRTRAPMPDLDEPYDAYVDRLTTSAPFLYALPSYWPEDAWATGGPRARRRPLGVQVSGIALYGWRPSWEPYTPPADPYATHRRRLARAGVEQAR